MPSGYTENVPEIGFEEFVWQCARGMGALIRMREEPADAPIPERFEPSDYHAEKLAEARAELIRLSALSEGQAAAECKEEYRKEESHKPKSLADNRERISAYQEMLRRVDDWKPPTKNHENFKEFMARQLRESIDFDDKEKYLQPKEMESAEVWLERKISKENRTIEYHARQHNEEVERTEAANKWLADLRSSLKKQG